MMKKILLKRGNRRVLKMAVLMLVLICVTSCVTTYRIEESEFDIIPYMGNEVLVFESIQGEVDTIKLKAYKRWSKTQRVPYRIFHNRYEHYGIKMIHTNLNVASYTPDFLIEIGAFSWKGLRINVRTKSDYYKYINKTRFIREEFDSLPSLELRIDGKTYSDVKIILGDTLNNKCRKPNLKNQVLQFYWSKKKGLLGWDSVNTNWRLKHIHIL